MTQKTTATPEMAPEQRLSEEEIAERTAGATALKRVYKGVTLGEDHGFRIGWEAKTAEVEVEAKAAKELASIARAIAPNPPADGDDDPSIDEESPVYLAGYAAGLAVAAAGEVADLLVKCPPCRGTGRMWGYGDQCKKCFGSGKVRASTLEPEEGENEDG